MISQSDTITNTKIFEMAHKAIQTLKIASKVLSPGEKETLELISDLNALDDLQASLNDAKKGELVSLNTILDK